MAGFVAFKAGAFDGYLGETPSQETPPDSIKKDSTQTIDPGFSSSKFMILSEEETLQKTNKDTTPDLDDIIIPSSKSGGIFDADDMPWMGSSKSGIIFSRDDSIENIWFADSTKDTTRKHTPNQSNSNYNRNKK